MAYQISLISETWSNFSDYVEQDLGIRTLTKDLVNPYLKEYNGWCELTDKYRVKFSTEQDLLLFTLKWS